MKLTIPEVELPNAELLGQRIHLFFWLHLSQQRTVLIQIAAFQLLLDFSRKFSQTTPCCSLRTASVVCCATSNVR
jgi:hypothetical protein